MTARDSKSSRRSDRRICPVVFVTAYDEYAVKAFELNAVDYLLKPLTITVSRTVSSEQSNEFLCRNMDNL
jgi:DNA-binding LytR/AlgR family response regulator